MTDKRKALGRNIHKARKRAGLTQEELAHAIGVKAGETVSQMEKGSREVKAWELSAIAKAVNVDFGDLLREDGPQYGPAPLWRAEPDSGEGLTETLLHLRSQRYHQVMKLTDSCGDEELPRRDDFDVGSASFRAVQRLARDVGGTLQLGARPAKQLFRVLEELFGVMIFYRDLGEKGSALSVRGDYGPAMLLNSREPPWRRTYSCAHELFHLVTWDALPSGALAHDAVLFASVETRANVFASALLLPEKAVTDALRPYSKDGSIDPAELIDIARDFGVSTSSLMWGMVNWGFLPRRKPENMLKDPAFRWQDRQTMSGHWWTPPELPERFVRLALIAHKQGEISQARLASMLETNLTELAALLEQYALSLEFDLVPEAEIAYP